MVGKLFIFYYNLQKRRYIVLLAIATGMLRFNLEYLGYDYFVNPSVI